MISAEEVRKSMGLKEDVNTLIDDIEFYIKDNAEKGKRIVKYLVPDTYRKPVIWVAKGQLEDYGYEVDETVIENGFTQFEIRW